MESNRAMNNELEAALTALAERLLLLAMQDADLRSRLRRLSQAFLQSTEDQATDPSPATAATTGATANHIEALAESIVGVDVDQRDGQADEAAAPAQLPELTLGRSARAELRPSYQDSEIGTTDFVSIEARCRLKAEGARWAEMRRRMLAGGANFFTEIEPKDRDIIARAKQMPNCYLWMCHSSGPSPANLALYDDVAGCFETVAQGLALIRQIHEEPAADEKELETALDLLAEAQSALRVAIGAMDGPMDSDQTEVFRWLKATANETQIFIRRFMRLDDAAEPAQWPAMLARIEDAETRIQEARQRRSERKKMLGKVRHKASLILKDPEGSAEEWKILISTVSELVAGGLPASNRELRELLIPVIENLPEQNDVPAAFALVLREIDRCMATCPPSQSIAIGQQSREVVEVAKLLRGRSLVLIGGDKRPGAYQALKGALGLRDLIWLETRAHESIDGFQPYVARPEVAAVMLAIRWSSHSYGEVKEFCDKHRKPLVRLPGGYNVNQVAAQIMNQCSERLGDPASGK